MHCFIYSIVGRDFKLKYVETCIQRGMYVFSTDNLCHNICWILINFKTLQIQILKSDSYDKKSITKFNTFSHSLGTALAITHKWYFRYRQNCTLNIDVYVRTRQIYWAISSFGGVFMWKSLWLCPIENSTEISWYSATSW